MRLLQTFIPDCLYSDGLEGTLGLLCVVAITAAIPLAVMGHPLRAIGMVFAVSLLVVD